MPTLEAQIWEQYKHAKAVLEGFHEEDKEKVRCLLFLLTDEEWDELKRREDLRRTHGVSTRGFAKYPRA